MSKFANNISENGAWVALKYPSVGAVHREDIITMAHDALAKGKAPNDGKDYDGTLDSALELLVGLGHIQLAPMAK